MNTNTMTRIDIRPAAALSFLMLAALAAFSGNADARCGMMKPTGYMGAPPGMPPHRMHHPKHRCMHHGKRDARGMKAGPSVIAVAMRAGGFSTLLAAVEKAGLTGLLEGDGPFTLFAPTDAAFENLPEGALAELLADKAKLTALLKYHVVPGRATAADILTKRTLETASGQALPTANLGVIRADIRARNGVIHVVDHVLLPTG